MKRHMKIAYIIAAVVLVAFVVIVLSGWLQILPPGLGVFLFYLPIIVLFATLCVVAWYEDRDSHQEIQKVSALLVQLRDSPGAAWDPEQWDLLEQVINILEERGG